MIDLTRSVPASVAEAGGGRGRRADGGGRRRRRRDRAGVQRVTAVDVSLADAWRAARGANDA